MKRHRALTGAAGLLLVALAALPLVRAGYPADPPMDVAVPRWELRQFSVQGRAQVANPFRDAALLQRSTVPG
jgi:hypothetical protein